MRTALLSASVTLLLLSALAAPARADGPAPLPRVAEGWKAELVVQAPEIVYPTAIVVAPDGTIYLGQDPMDMPGPPTQPMDSVVSIRNGKVSTFAEKLWSVMGLEWVDGTLYVVHAPYLTAFRDTNGDGRADARVDLITGLGPTPPGFNGINDHVASGIRLGMDGYLYIAVGDKGLPQAKARDGTVLQMFGGGVIRIRPDGTGLETVSTGERNPLSVALTATDEIFTYGNDDDSKKWPNSLTHHIVGGHYGYPYQFLTAPDRCLPVLAGKIGGAGAQGLCYNGDGLPEKYRGSLFFCDWGTQTVTRYEVERAGGTFRVKSREALVTKGDLADFRPFSLAPSADGTSLYLVDWAYDGWLSAGPQTGRLYRLTYTGPDRATPAARPAGNDLTARLAALDHPALDVRLESQRVLAGLGKAAVAPLARRLATAEPRTGRLHALWALDALNTPEARAAIRQALRDGDAEIRLQAVRSTGLRRDRTARALVEPLLRDGDAAVRREAAIALGRLGDRAACPALMAALGDADLFAGWSVRTAIRTLHAWDEKALGSALADPARRDEALRLVDEAWDVPVVNALRAALAAEKESAMRAKLVTTLAGLARMYPPWSGHWFGTNPLAGEFPRKTQSWPGSALVEAGLAGALQDANLEVRRQAIAGLMPLGKAAAAPAFRARLAAETDTVNTAAMAQALGALNDAEAVPALVGLMNDPKRPLPVRAAALDALAPFRDRQAMVARLRVVYDRTAPADLVARAVLAVGRAGVLPPNDLVGFLDHASATVRIAALWSLAAVPLVSPSVRDAILARLDDSDLKVRQAAISAIANLKLREGIPRLLRLAHDRDKAVRSQAVLALTALPDPRALRAYLDGLKEHDADLRKASEAALLAVRDLVADPLEAEVRAGRLSGPAAEAVERIVTRFVPIRDWRVIGPFPRTTAQVFVGQRSIDFEQTHVGAGGKTISWTTRRGDGATGRVVLDDFKAGPGDRGGYGYDTTSSPDLAAFACAEVPSDRDRTALALIGSSGGLLVVVNDQVVLNAASGAGRPYAPDSDRVRIPLKQGVNRILIQSRQGVGSWSFSLQLAEPSATVFSTRPGPAKLDELRAYALQHTGDAQRGEAIFFDPRGIGCARCHAVGGKGKATVGPDLAGLALKYDRAELVRSVLEPSSRIATGYQPVLVATTDGQVATGLVRSETAEHLELIDADGRVARVLKAAIAERRVSDVSLMPTGLVDTLSPAEFADLVAFLESLKSGAVTAARPASGRLRP